MILDAVKYDKKQVYGQKNAFFFMLYSRSGVIKIFLIQISKSLSYSRFFDWV